MARELQPEALISVGGGSTHDTAKGIATLLAEGGDIHDYEVRFEPPDRVVLPKLLRTKIPLLTVPTTMGGAELSRAPASPIGSSAAKSLSLIPALFRARFSLTARRWPPRRSTSYAPPL